MTYYYINTDKDGNMVIEESVLSRYIWVFLLGILGIMSFLPLYNVVTKMDFKPANLIMPVIGGFSLYMSYCLIIMKLKYIFFKNDNRIQYIKYVNGKKTHADRKYIHADIIKDVSSNRRMSRYNFLVFFGQNNEYLEIGNMVNPGQSQQMKKFCIDVLQRTINYREPDITLEKQTFNKENYKGLIMEMMRAIARGIT